MARSARPTRLQCPTIKGITAIHYQMLGNCLKFWDTFNVQGTLKGSHMQFCGVDKQECGCLLLCCTASAFKHAPEPARLLFVTFAMRTHGLDSSDMLCLAQHSTPQKSLARHSAAHCSLAQPSTAQCKKQGLLAKHSTKCFAKAQHSMHSPARHGTAQHSTAQHSTAQHSTAQRSAAQHSLGY